MHWLATKHVGVAVAMVFGVMSAAVGFVRKWKRRRGEPKPYLPGWVLPVFIAVLVGGCAVVCVAQI
jgi:ribose/xylose/arabinose/galactoside ABC-type transport system permease subunit